MTGAATSWPLVFAGRRFAVLGLGQNGLPAATALATMGADVTAWDDDAAKRDAAASAGIVLVPPSESATLDALVLSPGIPHRLPAPHPEAAAASARGVPILSDVELLYRAARAAGSRARFAGITGTNGKSTTTALLAHIIGAAGIPVAAGGNLGPAALALPLLPDHGIYVLEMSSYMLERIATMRFDAAAMLNITQDHLDRHGNMAGYEAAKAAIFARQTGADVAVIGIDDEPSRALASRIAASPARLIRISGAAHADVCAEGRVLRDHQGVIADLARAHALPGSHNAQNAAAAAAIALFLGVKRATIALALASFPGLPHRQALIATVDGVAFIDDSKATNADAAARAFDCHDRIVWIAGGIGKEGGIESLAPWFPRIDHALLIGRDALAFAKTLEAHGVSYDIAETLDRAVPAAFGHARARGVKTVLLSPAAASFDQFANYGARGDRFAELARALGNFAEAR
ncbi:UDP-N-acetylmuramoyl-L-alanine--D-glutamate ligase [Acidiphilium sp. AL]|uniref:UDP-N-acetylmuramoylalanine--D-glutamate ligase n=1 Tax=Acidiphilium iwatense TaxID=768198 RepID=A0ABS9DS31_9PROT|nr:MULTISPECIES: UDP-N-acetylmuramoyl-L-alanine--D-glutamate ligase [Acidiphilium]MCF3945540.1 UDP-N-acetylmuramoyl-L-alanine--D-glutamate ligase [Acidiphilium iwatense]MCU4159655.1 UDP-N-acetylmuramoyl-L-alanine--D-glutamate ligase [Acidiphilium sp. AL]